MLTLDKRFQGLEKLASTNGIRWALYGIHIETGRVTVTNGVCLFRADMGDEKTEASIVPADEWKKSFTGAKNGDLVKMGRDQGNEGVTIETPLGSRTAKQLEGRFPDSDRLMPEGEPTYTVDVNAKLMAQVLTQIAKFAPGGHHRVTLEFRDGDRQSPQPVKITCPNVEALVMPIVS